MRTTPTGRWKSSTIWRRFFSHVESRRVNNDYTIHLDWKIHQIARQDIRTGLRGAVVRVEKRGGRFCGGSIQRLRYVGVSICEQRPKIAPPKPLRKARRAEN